MKKNAWLTILFAFILNLNETMAQQKISFPAKDGIEVTADLYFLASDKPYVILLHQARYSRGEYIEIAPKIVNLGYNCIAVDLRSGNEVNGVVNETAKRAKERACPRTTPMPYPTLRRLLHTLKGKPIYPLCSGVVHTQHRLL